MKQIFAQSILAVSVILFITPVVSAQTTFGWNFGTGTGTFNSTTGSNPLITVSAVTVVNSSSATSLSNYSPSTGYTGASGNNNVGFGASSGAFNANTSSYLRITVTPATGYSIRVNDLDFGIRSSNVLNGAQNYALRTSVAGFGTAITGASGTVAQNGNWSLKNSTFTPINGALNAPVELRIYAYNGSAFGIFQDTWVDDISLNATPVPEPASIIGLSAMGMLGLGFLRKRLKK